MPVTLEDVALDCGKFLRGAVEPDQQAQTLCTVWRLAWRQIAADVKLGRAVHVPPLGSVEKILVPIQQRHAISRQNFNALRSIVKLLQAARAGCFL